MRCLLACLISSAVLLMNMDSVDAKHRHRAKVSKVYHVKKHVHKRHVRKYRRKKTRVVRARPIDLVTVPTLANPVVVAPAFAEAIQGFVADVVGVGFIGPVHCYARKGHIRNSLHYAGAACDFAQTGRNKTTSSVMYDIREFTDKWGLTDGCTFRHRGPDCGHIEFKTPYKGGHP